MSATGRSDVRRPDDFYETPAWCVHRLLEALPLPGGYWFEPAVGDGALLAAVSLRRSDVRWWTADVRRTEFCSNPSDFLQLQSTPVAFAVAITNPPYSLAVDFIRKMLPLAPHVVVLVRLNFLASARRSQFFRSDMPDVYVLPNRPSFTEDGRTDATEYCWLHWGPERGRRSGKIEVLAETTAEERR